jgi:hypothetical protein
VISLLLCTGFFCVIALPGVILVAVFVREQRWAGAVAFGSAAGLSAAIVGGYYLLRARIPFAYLLVVEYAAVALAVALRHGPRSQPVSRPAPAGDAHWAALLPLVFVSRAIPLFFSEIPLGFDPAFHTLIAQKILDSGTIPTDWLPFEPVKLNYPVGTHLLLAEAARFTGVSVHVVFKDVFPILASLTTVALYCVALRILRSERAAWYAAVVYSFLAVWGSLDYYRWGGLPNQLGMLFLLGLVETALAPRRRFTVPMFALLLASLIVSHHHGALCATLLFLGYASFSAALGKPLFAPARTMVAGSALGLLGSLVPLLSYARAAGEIGKTSVLEFYEPLISLGNAAIDLGIPLAILGSLGTMALFRAPSRPETLFLAFWITTFFAAFVLLEYVYRFGAYIAEGEFYTAFTPSRFLTDLAYPLSIAAGYALCELTQQLKRAGASLTVLVGALIWCGVIIAPQCVEADPEVDVAAFRWIATHTEENALVVSESKWAPYFTWRESAYTPLPASEARNDERVQSKRRMLLGESGAAGAFSRASRRATYVVAPLAQPMPDSREEVYRGERATVYRLAP